MPYMFIDKWFWKCNTEKTFMGQTWVLRLECQGIIYRYRGPGDFLYESYHPFGKGCGMTMATRIKRASIVIGFWHFLFICLVIVLQKMSIYWIFLIFFLFDVNYWFPFFFLNYPFLLQNKARICLAVAAAKISHGLIILSSFKDSSRVLVIISINFSKTKISIEIEQIICLKLYKYANKCTTIFTNSNSKKSIQSTMIVHHPPTLPMPLVPVFRTPYESR